MDESCIGWAKPGRIAHGDAAVVARWAITNAEKKFLGEYGVPATVDPFFVATVQGSGEPTLQSTSHGPLYRVGWDVGRYIAVAKGGAGVYAVHPQLGRHARPPPSCRASRAIRSRASGGSARTSPRCRWASRNADWSYGTSSGC